MRSRAYYKLEEIQRAQRLVQRGQRVVDLGCWPGGWLEAAARFAGPRGRVVGVDLARLDPPLKIPQVTALVGDFGAPEVCERIREQLGGAADVLLSDAAPKLTGIRDTDRANEERLLEAVERAIGRLLRPGGDALVKILEGPEAAEIARRLGRRFEKSRTLKPRATRKGSSERYLLARGWQPAGSAED